MRIAFVLYTSGQVSGGAAKHAHILPPLLAGDPRVHAVRVFAPAGALKDHGGGVERFEWPVSGPRDARRRLDAGLAAFAPDVIFVPSARFVGHPETPTVVMVRNMEPLLTPFAGNGLLDRAKNVARRFAAEHACRRADRIIAVSDHVRDFLTRRWNLDPTKIGVVYHGVEEPVDPRRPPSLDRLGDRPFLFSMGSIRPARGLDDLVLAMMDSGISPEMQMVFAGKVDAGAEHYFADLSRTVERLGLEDRIHWAGQLDANGLSWCFANARLFVMTSRAEACPNTVLEALRQGSFSVSGDNDPMPEFFGEAALYYRNGDPSSLAEMLKVALEKNAMAERDLRGAATERAKNYTWPLCAMRTVDELEQAINRRNR